MQAAFVHQSARHHSIVDEVADHEPIAGMDVGLGADQAQAELAARRDRGPSPGEPGSSGRRQRQRIAQVDAIERWAKRRREIASPQCVDLDLIEAEWATSGSGPASRALRAAVSVGTR